MFLKKFKEYLIVSLTILLIAISFNIFFFPFEMVIGGASGLAISLNYLLNISPAIIILIIDVFALIIGYLFLDKKTVNNSIYGSFVYPFFIYLTEPLKTYIISLNISSSDLLVFIILGSVISGACFGFLYKKGYTTGGSEIFKKIIHKGTGLTLGTSNFIVNFIIVVFGSFIIGFDKILYTILIVYIMSISIDRILIGPYSNKIFYIITKYDNEVSNFIIKSLNLTVTKIDSIGGYSNSGSKILMCVVPNNNYYKLKEGINKIDKEAFFLITHAYE